MSRDLRKNSVVKNTETVLVGSGAAIAPALTVPPDGAEASTRRRVFSAILAQGSATAAQLAGHLGITPAAIRRHLEALEEEGLIVARQPRPRPTAGRGRPAKVFQITDAGRDRFQQAYGELAVQAIAQLLAVAGPDGLGALARAHFWPIQADFDAIHTAHPAEPAGEVLVAALDAQGYAAEISPLSSGEQLCQHHCPVADVARQYPELCEIETKLIASLLKSHVQRLATIAHGDGVCTTYIPGPVRRPAVTAAPVNRAPAATRQPGTPRKEEKV